MERIVSTEGGIISSAYWCKTCMEFMETLEAFEREDGFEYGGLLNYDNYISPLSLPKINRANLEIKKDGVFDD
jgi:thiol-disulfide isomerase/thioredoxin